MLKCKKMPFLHIFLSNQAILNCVTYEFFTPVYCSMQYKYPCHQGVPTCQKSWTSKTPNISSYLEVYCVPKARGRSSDPKIIQELFVKSIDPPDKYRSITLPLYNLVKTFNACGRSLNMKKVRFSFHLWNILGHMNGIRGANLWAHLYIV